MLRDSAFEPLIIIIPDVARGEDYMFECLDKAYNSLSAKYQCVHHPYDKDKREFIDFSSKYDVIFTSNPYEEMTHRFYQIEPNLKHSLVCYVDYGYGMMLNWWQNKHNHNILYYIYQYFTNNILLARDLPNKPYIKNVKFVGSPKLDSLSTFTKAESTRKKIIIAPHWSVIKDLAVNASHFLEYHDFFLELPQKYPQIDFILRPHPLLFITLKNYHFWTQEQIDSYTQRFNSYENATYQSGGDYMETFANSDGIIHDCIAFMAEYLYTGNPCCYMIKDDNIHKKNFTPMALECIDTYYKARNEAQIIEFIDEVIINGKDSMKEKREKFFNENLKGDYPNASQNIVDFLKAEFGLKGEK